MVVYPERAAVNEPVAKAKIYAKGNVTARVKQLFVSQVDEIIWKFKLAPETINLPAGAGVPEIQVFAIRQKREELSVEVLKCIDRVVKFPIIFELGFGDKVREVACYKRPNATDSKLWVLSDYFEGEWREPGSHEVAMPLALDLAGLYGQLLFRLMPVSARPQESLAELVGRVEQVRAKRREVEKTAVRLEAEKQFNRRVEINATLRQLKNELKQLTR